MSLQRQVAGRLNGPVLEVMYLFFQLRNPRPEAFESPSGDLLELLQFRCELLDRALRLPSPLSPRVTSDNDPLSTAERRELKR